MAQLLPDFDSRHVIEAARSIQYATATAEISTTLADIKAMVASIEADAYARGLAAALAHPEDEEEEEDDAEPFEFDEFDDDEPDERAADMACDRWQRDIDARHA